MTPLNGNILVEPKRNQTEAIFKEDDSRKDLQYAIVRELPPEPIDLGNGKQLKLEDVVVYNPRNITMIIVEGKPLGMVHYLTLHAVV